MDPMDPQLGLAPAAPMESHDPEGIITYGPLRVKHEHLHRLMAYLQAEISLAEEGTREFREAVVRLREFLDPKESVKNFPWKNASNIKIPMPRIVTDALRSSGKRAILGQRKLLVAELVSREYAGIEAGQSDAVTRAAEKFGEYVCRDRALLDIPRLLDDQLEEMIVAGFVATKLVKETTTRNLAMGPAPEDVREVVLRAGPRIYAVPTGTLVWPSGLWRSVQDMPWIGNWIELTPSALRLRASDTEYGYRFVEEVIAGTAAGGEVDSDTAQRLQAIQQTAATGGIRIHEISIRWDLHGDGTLHDLLVSVHLPTGHVCRVAYNPTRDGQYPFEIQGAVPRVGTMSSRAILPPMKDLCSGINDAINQTFDSQTLANSPSVQYPEDGPMVGVMANGWFPGAPAPYRESPDEVKIMEFPQPSSTSFTMVQFFLGILDRLTHIGSSYAGDPSAGKRTPATLGLSMQQLSNELIDEFVERVRVNLGTLLSRAFRMYYEDDPGIFERIAGEDGRLLADVIRRSIETNRGLNEMIRIRLYASSASRNKELDRQNTLATSQLLMSYFTQVAPVAMSIAGGQAPPEAVKILTAILTAMQVQMRKAVEATDQMDVEVIVPDLVSLLGKPAEAPGEPSATGYAPPPPQQIDPAAIELMSALAQQGGAG